MALPSSHGSLPEADVGMEVRFTGGFPTSWRITQTAIERHAPALEPWLATENSGGTRRARIGNRVALGLHPGTPRPEALLRALGLRSDRTLKDGLWILQASSPWAAARAAHHLAAQPGVAVATPIMKRALALHGSFAPRPTDPYFTNQWHLENRDSTGRSLGPDTNPRGAWALTRGEGVTLAICDDGFETNHADLKIAAAGSPHFDFTRSRAGAPTYGDHSTAVAGLVAARGGNQTGVAGLAPGAQLSSSVIFDAIGDIASDEGLMDMFQHEIQTIGVQNHSWGNADPGLLGPTAVETQGLDNALANGRGGLGVVMVRSGGNGRENSINVNDDGYANDPRAIAVAAIRQDGRAASYSCAGACLLVGAPSGDDADDFKPTPNLFTTDRSGSRGYNRVITTDDLADYAFDATGFSGTSASAPQISGIVALLLSANPRLSVRDVQQILVHSSRHYDRTDPDLATNAAGFEVSHNQGFGIPDAGEAVRLAVSWSNRPPVSIVSIPETVNLTPPDDGLRVWVTENENPERSIRCLPALGPHPDNDTKRLPLVFVGRATNELSLDLRGKAALIERGTNYFRDKLVYAGRAGASFAVIFNHVDGDQLIVPAATDYVPIPAVFISENEGRALVTSLEAGNPAEAQLRLDSVSHAFAVTNPMICEHVGLRVVSTHERRGDLRITLVSPGGTRSILQHRNSDTETGPNDWTFWTVQHFYESTAGTWRAFITDEDAEATGEIQELELILRGVPIADTDHDALDDTWERAWFGDLNHGTREDPDGDGASNAREQARFTSPTRNDAPLRVEVASYAPQALRLSWPATGRVDYEVLVGDGLTGQTNEVARVTGQFPSADWVQPVQPEVNRFFRVQEIVR
ncbi:MAG: S8 family serine peptidase [Verrucomicrobiales bacterium]|nr:S8 family serine peptidase [Verrucomicrobiales bacterium]